MNTGRFDKILYPFYKAELEEKRGTKEQAQELADSLHERIHAVSDLVMEGTGFPAIHNDRIQYPPRFIEVCPENCREVIGKLMTAGMTAGEVLDVLVGDFVFYRTSRWQSNVPQFWQTRKNLKLEMVK